MQRSCSGNIFNWESTEGKSECSFRRKEERGLKMRPERRQGSARTLDFHSGHSGIQGGFCKGIA